MGFSCTYLTEDKNIQSNVETFINDWYSSSKIFKVNTSGSTGLPKEIYLDKICAENSARLTGDYFDFKTNDTILLCISPETIGGKMIIIRAIVWQMHLIVVTPTRNPLKQIETNIDFASVVPLQIQSILEESPSSLSQIKTVLIGGGPLNFSVKEKLNSVHQNCFESFGMTETYSHIALRKCSNNTHLFNVLNGIEISIINTTNQLCIQSKDLGINNLITNDIVSIPNKNQFDWLGRIDFVINSGGMKFHPELIERKLENCIKLPFFIHKEPSAEYGEIIILILESVDSSVQNDYLSAMKVILSKYEIPKKIYFMDAFVRTDSNKINRIETYNSIVK